MVNIRTAVCSHTTWPGITVAIALAALPSHAFAQSSWIQGALERKYDILEAEARAKRTAAEAELKKAEALSAASRNEQRSASQAGISSGGSPSAIYQVRDIQDVLAGSNAPIYSLSGITYLRVSGILRLSSSATCIAFCENSR